MNGLFVDARNLLPAAVGIMLAALSGCTNEDYNLDELDTDVTFLKDVSIPLGNLSETITLDEILDLADGKEYIEADDNGNLSFVYESPNELPAMSFSIPEISLTGNSGSDGSVRVKFDEIDLGFIETEVQLPDIELHLPEITYEITIDNYEFPVEIKDIKCVEFEESPVLLRLGFEPVMDSPVSGITLRKGSKLTFPEWMEIYELLGQFTRSDDGHVFTLNEDVMLHIGRDDHYEVFFFALESVDFDRIPDGQGITEGRLHIDDKVTLEADMIIPGGHIKSSGTFSPVFFTSLTTDMSVSKIIADFDVDIENELDEIHLEGLPEFLTDDDNVFDFTDVRLDIAFCNKTPFSGRFSIDVNTFSMINEIASVTVSTPEFSAVTSDGQTYRWSFAESDVHVPQGYEYVNTPGLNGLFSRIPERITFENLSFTRSSDEYIEIVPGMTYEGGELSYSLCAPLAFGDDLNLSFEMFLENLDVRLESTAELSLDMVNTIPLDFILEALPVDDDGNVIPDIGLSLGDAPIKAGTLTSPQTSSLKLRLENKDDVISFDGIKLILKASGNSAYAGTHLNVNQGFALKNLLLTLPDGISTEL